MYIEEGAGEYGKKWGARIEDLGEKERRGGLSVVLFQVCIRFVFQSIMFGVRRAPKACPIQKKEKKKRKGRARERRRKGKMTSVEGKGDGRISGRNRNVLLLPRTPTIEAKYARTVTDKVVVAMRKHRARANPRRERSFFPSLLPAPSETN